MKKKYTLVGVDGNAFAVMGYVKNAMRRSGFSKEEINAYLKRSTSSDYNNLLAESARIIDDCNNR